MFMRCYVGWISLRIGFLGVCNPLIGVDGCHIKGKTEGQILKIISIDENNSLYPISYTIAKNECDGT